MNPAMIEELASNCAWIMDTIKFEADTGINQIPGYIRGEDEQLAYFLLTVAAIEKYGLPEGRK